MKITLDISREELRKMIGESDTFFLAYNSDRLQIVDANDDEQRRKQESLKQEKFLDMQRDIFNNLNSKSNLVEMVKLIRTEPKYFDFIKEYCNKNNIIFTLYNIGTLSLRTAKEFVENFKVVTDEGKVLYVDHRKGLKYNEKTLKL